MDKIREHEDFIAAIRSKRLVLLTFFSKEDGHDLKRTCAPVDYGTNRRKGRICGDRKPRYHFWDYDSDKKSHVLSKVADEIRKIEFINKSFDPNEFIKDFNISINPWWITRSW